MKIDGNNHIPTRVRPGWAARMAAAVTATVTVLAALAMPTSAAGTGWYCTRAADHRQPIADPPLRAVEEHSGYYIDHRHSDPEAADKVLYLTFDAGYENGNVQRTLDVLAEEGVTGAFFILGHLVEAEPDLVARMAAEGHLVCNHTYGHPNLCGRDAAAVEREVTRLETVCRRLAGVEIAKYFRPPEGCFDIPLLQKVEEMGYKTVFWSFAYADWDNARQPDPASAKKKILDNLHNGAVILLHPTSATNAAILGEVIREAKAQGYRFGTLDELTGGGR